MAQMTVAQLREREIDQLVALHTDTPTEQDFTDAKRLMTSYYRLVGLSERNLYLSNEERTCNLKSTQRSEEREDKWYRRLTKEFKDFCGMRLTYYGYFPSIVDTNGSIFSTHFYN